MSEQFKTGEVNFDDIPSEGSTGQRRGASYLNMKDPGQYKIRIVSSPHQYFCHWVETVDGRRRKVNATCDSTDPIVADQGKGPQKKWLLKVLHLNGDGGGPELKILDAGRQILSQIKALHTDEENFGNVSKYDIIIKKGQKGENPLYTVQALGSASSPRPLNEVEKELITESNNENSDQFIDLARLTQPWTAERILEVVNGGSGSSEASTSQSISFVDHDFDTDDDDDDFLEI